jgi:hypothetical protein
MFRPRNFKLGMMMVHDQQMKPIDFGVKVSKVKVSHIDLVRKNSY